MAIVAWVEPGSVIPVPGPGIRGDWAAVLTGQSGATLAGVHFGADPGFLEAEAIPEVRKPDAEAIQQRLQHFFTNASPRARELAGLAAAAPVTLDVVRLIQQTRLTYSRQTHLAELFVSGLLRREPELDLADGEPLHDFHSGVRRTLLDLSTTAESVQVLREVSTLLAGRFSRTLDFEALLELPSSQRAQRAFSDLANALDDRNTRHFASIAALVLARLGGRYARIAEDDEPPAHEVTLSQYAVAEHPVTVGEFRKFVEATGFRTEAEQRRGGHVWDGKGEWITKSDASWRIPYIAQDERHPVVCVSSNDAKAYCVWLSKKTRQTYGLLTEAQWEHACRAGSDAAFCFGGDESQLGNYAWYGGNAPHVRKR